MAANRSILPIHLDRRSHRILLLALPMVISLLMHLPHFGKELMSVHAWRQAQTQTVIDNFYQEDMNILNPRINNRGSGDGIFRMEFPLMQWMVALLYHLFGPGLVITRFTMFVTGLFSVYGLYRLLRTLFSSPVPALAGAWALTFSPVFFYYTINPMPDNLALCLAIWGLNFFFRWLEQPRAGDAMKAGFFLAAAALVKLPFILFYAPPAVVFLQRLFRKKRDSFPLKSPALMFLPLVLPVAWYAWVIPGWKGNGIVGGILQGDTSLVQILDYLRHNLVVTLPEMLLNYGSLLFFAAGIYFVIRNRPWRDSRAYSLGVLGLAVLAYFFFEINMIARIHDYYLFPFLPLLFILVGYGAWKLLRSGKPVWRYLALFLLLVLPLTCWLRMEVRWDPENPGFNPDLLIHKEALQSAVPEDALVVAGNDISPHIFLYHLDRKGWSFSNDHLPASRLENQMEEGAEYLFSDSRKVDTASRLQPMLDSLVLERGSFRVYRLR